MARDLVSLDALDALPDRGYRDRVRGLLKKYRAASGQGGRTLAKACCERYVARVRGEEGDAAQEQAVTTGGDAE